MSPRSLFNIILKVIGIYFITTIFVALPTYVTLFYYYFSTPSANSKSNFSVILLILLSIFLFVLVIYFLLFKTNKLIDLFNLDKGLNDDYLSINLHRSTVLTIAIIVIGGIIVIEAIPVFTIALIDYWQPKQTRSLLNIGTTRSLGPLIAPGIKLLIGLLLLGNTKAIVNLIELKRRKTTTPQPGSSTDPETDLSSE